MPFTLVKKIAHGGMAEVFLAKETKQGSKDFKIWCVKRIISAFNENEEFKRMFVDEYSVTKKFTHPNLIAIKNMIEIGGQDCMVMEYVPGVDIRDILIQCEKSKIRLSIEMCCYLVAEFCLGLDYVHHLKDENSNPLKIVHRDISPQNILVSFDGMVKVIDFGVADNAEKSNLTKPGVVKGKFSYMSPEQVLMKPIDHRTDVFAAGVVLWEMLSMKKLFQGRSEIETLELVKAAKIREDLRKINPLVTNELAEIVHKALAKKIDNRYSGCKEFESALRSYLKTNHPAFTKNELAEFVRKILPEKYEKMKQNLQYTIQFDPHQEKSSTAGSGKNTKSKLASFEQIAKHSSRSKKYTSSKNISKNIDFLEHEINSNKNQFPNSIIADKELLDNKKTFNLKNKFAISQRKPTSNSPDYSINTQFSSSKKDYDESPSSNKKNIFLGLVAVIILIFTLSITYLATNPDILLNANDNQVAIINPTVTLISTPNRVKISINNQALDENYVKTPITINQQKFKTGQNTIVVSRDGFENKTYNFFKEENFNEDKSIDLVLKKAQEMGPLILSLKGTEIKDDLQIGSNSLKIDFAFNENLEVGQVTKKLSRRVNFLVKGKTYEMTIKSQEKQFNCKLTISTKTLITKYIINHDTESCNIIRSIKIR